MHLRVRNFTQTQLSSNTSCNMYSTLWGRAVIYGADSPPAQSARTVPSKNSPVFEPMHYIFIILIALLRLSAT